MRLRPVELYILEYPYYLKLRIKYLLQLQFHPIKIQHMLYNERPKGVNRVRFVTMFQQSIKQVRYGEK